MASRNMPLICADDYNALRRIQNSDFPHTYDEWLKHSARRTTDLLAKGYVIIEVKVEPDEFIRDCADRRARPDIKSLEDFALKKSAAKP